MTHIAKTTVGIRTSLFSKTVQFLTEILNLEIINYDKKREFAQLKLHNGKIMKVLGTKILWHPFTTPPEWEVIVADIRGIR